MVDQSIRSLPQRKESLEIMVICDFKLQKYEPQCHWQYALFYTLSSPKLQTMPFNFSDIFCAQQESV